MHYFTPKVEDFVITNKESANKLQPSTVITILCYEKRKQFPVQETCTVGAVGAQRIPAVNKVSISLYYTCVNFEGRAVYLLKPFVHFFFPGV